MQEDRTIKQKIVDLEARIERAENCSSGSIEEESRIDDLYYQLLKLEDNFKREN